MRSAFSQVIGRYRLPLSVLAACVMLAGVVQSLRESNLGISYVSVVGEVDTNQRKEIFRELADMNGLADIGEIKVRLEAIDWIHQVAVARDWPDRLVITIREEEAIAYWNEDAYINEQGHVFVSPYAEGGRLPQLYGPEGRERDVMLQYQQLSQVLLRTGQVVDTLMLDERGSWAFATRSGMQVLLGKEDIMKRMQRYVGVFQQAGLLEEMSRIARVDTRYSNGVAVDWKESTEGYEVAKAYKLQREVSL